MYAIRSYYDAIMLARMGLERNLTLWNRPAENLRILKRLSRERIAIIRDKNALTNQLHALKHSHQAFAESVKRLKERITLAEKQLKEISAQMHDLIKETPELNEKIKRVITIPGINFVTAATVIAETDGFSNISNRRQLVSYVGLDVVARESGTLKWRPHISKRGNAYNSVNSVIGSAYFFDPTVPKFYENDADAPTENGYVITSYSIHYTKLYESRLSNVKTFKRTMQET